MNVETMDLQQAVSSLLAGDPLVVRNPYPVYRRMREKGSVYWHKPDMPFVTTHAEARAALQSVAGALVPILQAPFLGPVAKSVA